MNLYEPTIVARQDTSPSQIKQLSDKYIKIVEKNDGEIVQAEEWGLLNLAYIIKKNKKGSYIHFKIKGPGKIIEELEKNEILDKNLLRYMTVKVKKFDLEAKYFSKKEEYEKKEYKKDYNRT
jgi:small subunit ribosomal protein S6